MDGSEGGRRSWLIPLSWHIAQITPDNGEKGHSHSWKWVWQKGTEQMPSLWSWPCPVSPSGCNQLGSFLWPLCWAPPPSSEKHNLRRHTGAGSGKRCCMRDIGGQGGSLLQSPKCQLNSDREERCLGWDTFLFLPIKESSSATWNFKIICVNSFDDVIRYNYQWGGVSLRQAEQWEVTEK